MEDVLKIAEQNSVRAGEILARTGIMDIWRSVGAEPNLIGSARMGLMIGSLDIDIHVYSDPLTVEQSFEAMSRFAAIPGVRTIQYGNLIDTEEECIEWHATYEAAEGEVWKFDMIHIRRGSRYDGHMERTADSIMAVLTPETRRAILQLKNQTPAEARAMGIEYYKAVIADGVRTLDEFNAWREANPPTGVIEWIP
jgi:hypothetical protein